jgi:hypothetical protein
MNRWKGFVHTAGRKPNCNSWTMRKHFGGAADAIESQFLDKIAPRQTLIMKLPEAIKLEIQCFVYFLFKGTMDPRLIASDFDYLDKLLDKNDLLYDCFEVFVYATQKRQDVRPNKLVADYILALHGKMDEATLNIVTQARESNKESITYWTDFLQLAKWFCYNSFPDPLKVDYIKGLNGCGTDAVQAFALWTNVVELDGDFKVVNSDKALKRANERIKSWDNAPSIKFEEWELEQEIY